LKILKEAISSEGREDLGKRECGWREEGKAAALASFFPVSGRAGSDFTRYSLQEIETRNFN